MSLPPALKGTAGRFPVRHQTLGGVPTAILKNPAAPTAGIVFAFKDGVAYESEELWGVAHLLEHMVFRGTEKHPSLYEVSRRAESVGGRVSAYSTRDAAAFWVKMPAGAEEEALGLLVELLTRPLLRPEHLESEKTVISQERRRELTNPGLVSSLLLENILLHPDPASRHPIGTEEGVARLDCACLREHLGRAYHRGAMAVSAAGNLSAGFERALAKALEAFPRGPARKRASFKLSGGFPDVPTHILPSHHKNQVHLSVGWRFPVTDEEERSTWQALNTLLGAGYTSLLNVLLREKEALTYLCTTKLVFHGGEGVFKINLALDDKDLARVLPLIDGLLGEVKERKISETLFSEAVVRHAAGLVFQLEDSVESARVLGHSLLRGDETFTFMKALEGLERVDFARAAELAGTHLQDRNRKIVLQTGSPEARRVFPGAASMA
jgi:predicted Zn-dependent peptidase